MIAMDMPDYPVNGASPTAVSVRDAPGSATAPGNGVPAQQSRGGTQHADGTPVRVLVVDDEPSLAELLSSVLRYEGWSVRTAGNGADAVRSAREFRPDAVVLDIMLPDFDGVEVMRRMRQDLPDICVLFLTARDAVEDRVAGLTAGGDDTSPSRSAWRRSSPGCGGCCAGPTCPGPRPRARSPWPT